MSGNFHTSEYLEKANDPMTPSAINNYFVSQYVVVEIFNKTISKIIKNYLMEIHKLKRENLVLSDRRKSALQCKSNFNNAKYHYYCKEDFQILFNISECIGKNGNKIQRLRTNISQLKKNLIPVVDE